MTKSCATCSAFAPNPGLNDGAGFCRREPPKVFLLPSQIQGGVNQQSVFPAVLPGWYCISGYEPRLEMPS